VRRPTTAARALSTTLIHLPCTTSENAPRHRRTSPTSAKPPTNSAEEPNEEEFKVSAEHLARRAAEEVERYRRLFPSVMAVSKFYLSCDPPDGWPVFHAGIACALAGKLAEARRFFNNLIEDKDDDRDWVVELQADAEYLSALAVDGERFRQVVIERVRQGRDLLKLPVPQLISFGEDK
jgi:hypothetical protein